MSDDQADPGYPPPAPPRLEQPRNAGNHMFMTPRNQPDRDAWAADRWSINGWMYKEIAAAMDISKSNAYESVQRGLRASRDITQATAEQARAAHRARLDRATEVAIEVMERDHVTVSHGKVIKDDEGKPILDDAPKLAAAGQVKALSESLRKLDGLDAPTRTESTVTVAPQDIELAEIIRLAEAKNAAEEARLRGEG